MMNYSVADRGEGWSKSCERSHRPLFPGGSRVPDGALVVPKHLGERRAEDTTVERGGVAACPGMHVGAQGRQIIAGVYM